MKCLSQDNEGDKTEEKESKEGNTAKGDDKAEDAEAKEKD